MNRNVVLLLTSACLVLFPHAAIAQTAPATPALGTDAGDDANESWIDPSFDLRYRYEFVDQDGFLLDAHASTLRARLGVQAEPVDMLTLFAQAEAVVHLGPEKFNDGTNGVVARPIVADPEDLLLNQLYARLTPAEGASITAGRQAVNYDNQRWIGSVGWRQNDQTLDAVTASVTDIAGADVFASYGYAWRVNRIFGPDVPQGIWTDNDIHLVRVGGELGTLGTLIAYGYWLDLPEAPAMPSRTIGARLSGSQGLGAGPVRLTYALEFARQSAIAANSAPASHSYLLVEPGIGLGAASLRLGYERLAGDGTTALQTPLATLHAFNGWADKFLATPPAGLRDLYVDAAYAIPQDRGIFSGTRLRVAYHDFRSTEGSLHYGREWNAMVGRDIWGPVSLTLKFAHYDARAFATDTTKLWLQLEARF